MKKVLLGMAIAALAVIAYKKVPLVQSTCGKIGNSVKDLAKKAGEKLAKTEVKAETPETKAE
jgi:hypothetical protein